MFWQYFGNYLVEKNKISCSQFWEIMLLQQQSSVRLGTIAVAEKLLTENQAEEIHQLQRQIDRRFGDIAIDKGYLLAEEVTYLLNKQESTYLKFVQAITDSNLMTLKEIEACLENFKNDFSFTDSEIEALKSENLDRIIPIFIDVDTPYIGEYIGLFIRNIYRFINHNIRLNNEYKVREYDFEYFAYQYISGPLKFFVGVASKSTALLKIANSFAKEEFTYINEDSFDSVCEFINCVNGLYTSKLSYEEMHLEMAPPLFSTHRKVSSTGDIYVVPIYIEGEQIDLLVALNNQTEVI